MTLSGTVIATTGLVNDGKTNEVLSNQELTYIEAYHGGYYNTVTHK
jgi:hypothetical protein